MSVSVAADVMKPGSQCARTHSKPGFMPSRRTRGTRIAVLAVPVLPESGSRGSRARQRLQAKRHRVRTGTMPHCGGYRDGGVTRNRAAGGTAEADAADEAPGNRGPGRVRSSARAHSRKPHPCRNVRPTLVPQ